MKRLDITGRQFGRLTAMTRDESVVISGTPRTAWNCQCSCGSQVTVLLVSLTTNNTRSCGCLNRESANKNVRLMHKACRTHNMSRSAEYVAWTGMRQRCLNPLNSGWRDYGGRGISVCDRWMKFGNFLSDMGPKPGPVFSLDRIDNNGNYEPKNCRWADKLTQYRNRRVRHIEEFSIEELTAKINRRMPASVAA